MSGLVYSHPLIYSLLMRLLYGRGFQERYRAVAGLIPDGSRVNDLCCGDGYIYFRYLRRKGVHYTGFDENPAFVRHLERRSVPARRFDLFEDELPSGDCLLLQASLYQFIPRHEEVLARLLASDHRLVIISEPVTNLSSAGNPLVRTLAQRVSATRRGPCRYRFSREQLLELFARHGITEVGDIGRELIGVFHRQS